MHHTSGALTFGGASVSPSWTAGAGSYSVDWRRMKRPRSGTAKE